MLVFNDQSEVDQYVLYPLLHYDVNWSTMVGEMTTRLKWKRNPT